MDRKSIDEEGFSCIERRCNSRCKLTEQVTTNVTQGAGWMEALQHSDIGFCVILPDIDAKLCLNRRSWFSRYMVIGQGSKFACQLTHCNSTCLPDDLVTGIIREVIELH
jgi:hypothetical protein